MHYRIQTTLLTLTLTSVLWVNHAQAQPQYNIAGPSPSPSSSRIALRGRLDWTKWRDWIPDWREIALDRIVDIRMPWKEWVLRQGLSMVIDGLAEGAVTTYYRRKGLFVPEKPWWLKLPPGWAVAWPILTAAENAGGDAPRKGALYRYTNDVLGDRFYTTNWNELGGGRGNYRYEGVQCQVVDRNLTATPFYRYVSNSGLHFYTTNWNELGAGRGEYRYEGIQGYVFAWQPNGTVPLYRYLNTNNGSHFYTTNWNELGGGRWEYKYEGVACYVYP